MNRRDVIIITVLINTGLLSALVMMAINIEEEILLNQPESNQFVFEKIVPPSDETEPLFIAQNTHVATDEWDTVLKDYVSSSSSQMMLEEELKTDVTVPIKPIEPKKQVTITPKRESEKKADESKKVLAAKLPVQEDKVIKGTIAVTVKRGDALEKIARTNGTTVEQIRALNHLKNDRLTIGQTLLVPFDGDKSVKVEVKNDASSVSSKNGIDEVEYYVIKSGDNPWKIAKQYHVKFEDLLKLNHLDEDKARNLKIGDRIRVK